MHSVYIFILFASYSARTLLYIRTIYLITKNNWIFFIICGMLNCWCLWTVVIGWLKSLTERYECLYTLSYKLVLDIFCSPYYTRGCSYTLYFSPELNDHTCLYFIVTKFIHKTKNNITQLLIRYFLLYGNLE